MKKTLMKLAVLLALVGGAALTACDGAASLSRKVEGEWSGSPMRVDRKVADDLTLTPTFRFDKGGDLTVIAQLSAMMPVNSPIDSLGTSAVSATAAGVATVRGTWRATDDDDIDLDIDLSTLDVTMDPDVEFELANIWTASDVPTTRTVSEPVRRAFTKQMTEGVTNTLRRLKDLDDVHVDKTGTQLTAKFLKTKQTLVRVTE